jgi:polyketide synthase PksL
MLSQTHRTILDKISKGQLSAEEGYRLLKEPRQRGADNENGGRARPGSASAAPASSAEQGWQDIAIIGMSGQFPDAHNVHEFWDNLANGRNSIREIPSERWSLDDFYDEDHSKPGRSYGKWGGFLPEVGQFDPMFFNITPKEAEYMDPRQRLFLQEAFHALEDAGYAGKDLEGEAAGVFVGSQEGDYFAHYTGEVNAGFMTGNSNSLLAARLSYFLNLKGPSLQVDTACSSSLVAIALACESLLSGQSTIAIAGGASLLVSQKLFIALSKLGMLSPDGLCKTFDNAADGLVPGEVVGAVVLKPLAVALRDGDHVYGVISGYGLNQDGKTNGITAPSAPSQTALVRDIYERFGIDPEQVSYIETHGTGTKLGDPIEINALTDAFRNYTDREGYCALGSVKTNIGHSLPASGMASLIKVLLSLQHKQLAPNLHLKQVNEHIALDGSPFFVNTSLRDWNPAGGLRIAGISSFGMSGTNAHLVVRELRDEERAIAAASREARAQLVVLSAKTEDALQRKLTDFAAWFDGEGAEQTLTDIAYTLHVGRMHYKHRVAFVARDTADLKKILGSALAQSSAEGYVAQPPKSARQKPEPALKQLGKGLLHEVQEGVGTAPEILEKLTALADLYVKGYDLNWSQLYPEGTARRLPLPTYPFAAESYWLPSDVVSYEPQDKRTVESAPAKLHPLLDRNTSTLREQRFTAELAATGKPLADYALYGRHVLSGGALTEMIRAAGALAEEAPVTGIHRLTVAQPVAVGEAMEVQVRLQPNRDGADVEISSQGVDGERLVHAQAEVIYEGELAVAALDLATVRTRCTKTLEAAECEQELTFNGWRIASAYNAIQSLRVGENEALIELALTQKERASFSQQSVANSKELAFSSQQSAINSKELFASSQHSAATSRELTATSNGQAIASYHVHPSFIDGALHGALVWLAHQHGQELPPHFLYAAADIELYARTPESGFAHVVLLEAGEGSYKIDLLLTDAAGQPVANLRGVELVALERPADADVAENGTRRLLLVKEWCAQEATVDPAKQPSGTVIVLANGETAATAERLLAGVDGVQAVVVDCEGKAVETEGRFAFDGFDPEQGRAVAAAVADKSGHITCVIDLSDVRSQSVGACVPAMGKFALLQELIKRPRQDELELLHVTYGLQTFENTAPTLAGAETAALVKMLSAEYRKVRAHTVDTDGAADNAEGLREIVLREWTAQDPESEVLYRNGHRFVPHLREMEAGKSVPTALSPEKVYVVTGGTRGIGAEIAQHLVQNGARKLVLMGVQPYPARSEWERLLADPQTDAALANRLQKVRDLEAQGVTVEIFAGQLSDKEKVASYFADIRTRLGAIGGVMHCGGLAIHNNPAFIFKTPEDMAKVFEPKIPGLQVLHDVFAADRPDFFILFASVSGLIPTLASSAADYAIANNFMDTFAAYQRAHGFDFYQSIQWPSWKEVGMGEVKSPMYIQLGLLAHTTADGMKFLDRILSRREHVSVMPVVVKADTFKTDVLLYGRQNTENAMVAMQKAAAQTQASASIAAAVPAPALSERTSASVATAIAAAVPSEQASAPAAQTAAPATSSGRMLHELKEMFSRELKIPADRLDDDTPFGEWGVDSILLAELVKKVEAIVNMKLDPSIFLEFPTLQSLSGHLEELTGGTAEAAATDNENRSSSPANANELAQTGTASATAAANASAMANSATAPVAASGHAHAQTATATTALSASPTQPHQTALPLFFTKPRTLAPLTRAARRTPAAATAAAPTGFPKVAVIGMACHFPGAPDKDTYWRNLAGGVNSIVEIPADRWDKHALYAPEYGKGKSISKWGGFIRDIDLFDAKYFRFSEEDAPYIDPLMRQFLEVSVDTLHDAGYTKKELSGRKVSVFVGSRAGLYAPHLDSVNRNGILGIGQNFIAAHASHFFNWKGPNLVVDTACSSALVAIHLACQSLFSGESEMALAGGVDILLDEKPYLLLSEGRALSPDGQCRTFDEKANGFVPGEGCGAVLLKLLDQAIADGDQIYAVIDSTAINNDGHTMGATTPNPEMQSAVIRDALRKGELNASTISFIEAHGTGTMIGDPIELRALTRIFREFTPDTQFCGVGSVKTNFGHLLSAAGIASFIKVALSLHHKQMPPSLNCDRPNPRFEFANSPFYVNTSLSDWEPREGIRRAGISSFGFGGTNAHVIVGEAEQDLLANYVPTREPLPPVAFNRQRYWYDQVNEAPAVRPDWQREAAAAIEGEASFLQIVDEPEEDTGSSFLSIVDETEIG